MPRQTGFGVDYFAPNYNIRLREVMVLLALCNVAIDMGFSQKKTLAAEVLSPRLLNFRCFRVSPGACPWPRLASSCRPALDALVDLSYDVLHQRRCLMTVLCSVIGSGRSAAGPEQLVNTAHISALFWASLRAE